MSGAREVVRSALGRPELARVWAAARRRLEEGTPARSFSVADLTEGEAAALAQVLGSPTQARGRARVSVAALDQALRASRLGVGLREVLEILSGPLVDRRVAREAEDVAREATWRSAAAHAAVARHPRLAGWLEDLRRSGGLARAAGTGGVTDESSLLLRALDVLARLPAGGASLSVLAAEVTGDAHALDPDRSLGGLVLRAGARIVGQVDAPGGASARRRLWAELGVSCDPLSSHVVMLGLRLLGRGLIARQLNECAEAGEPRRVMLRELQREVVAVAPGTSVFVCENPSVIAAAADQLGAGAAPLVCTEGMPSSAAMQLLAALVEAGARVGVHADFDWGGIRIVNFLGSRIPAARPWRFSRADYDRGLSACSESAPLLGARVDADWDPELASALAESGRAVLEEHVLGELLGDLEVGGGDRRRE